MRCQTQYSENPDLIETAQFLGDCLREVDGRLSDAKTLGKRESLLFFIPHWAFTNSGRPLSFEDLRKDYQDFLCHLQDRGHTILMRTERPRFGQVVGYNPVIAVHLQVQSSGGTP